MRQVTPRSKATIDAVDEIILVSKHYRLSVREMMEIKVPMFYRMRYWYIQELKQQEEANKKRK
jgi:hypothetical protein